MKRINRIGFGIALAFILGIIAVLAQQPTPTAGEDGVNQVQVEFATVWDYGVDGDSFTNTSVDGQQWWKATMWNIGDTTGGAVSNATLTLESTLAFDQFPPPEPTIQNGRYEWSFGDVPEEEERIGHVGLTEPPPVTYYPGFDVSRSADVMMFSSEAIQTLIITVTPRVTGTHLDINVMAQEDDLVNPIIISPASGEGVNLSPDGHFLGISTSGLPLDELWTIEVKIEVRPKVPQVEYVPMVVVSKWDEPGPSASDVVVGDSIPRTVSYTVNTTTETMGTWTWSGSGTYEWDWHDTVIRLVYLQERRREVVNDVLVASSTLLHFSPLEDAFTNRKVPGNRQWSTSIQNRLSDPEKTLSDVTLTLESGLTFDHVGWGGLTTLGPPLYEWYFGALLPGGQTGTYVAFETSDPSPVPFTPGFDASRSADKTVFCEEGTQTLTIIVKPVAPLRAIVVNVGTPPHHPLVNAVIISGTGGEGRWISPDGQNLGMWVYDPLVNTEYGFTVTIEVTPDSGVSGAEFVPFVQVADGPAPTPIFPAGTDSLFTWPIDGLGTWTWRIGEEHAWSLVEEEDKAVRWHPGVRPLDTTAVAEPNPASVGSAVNLTGMVTTCPPHKIVSAEYSLDGGDWTPMSAVDETFDSPAEEVQATISAYSEAGVHEVCVHGTDDEGNTGPEACIFLVVYDPEGGFVTGSGWIDSPEGAYALDPLMAGKANFGFVSKYKKGATVPTGQTEFQFKVADLNFYSDTYDWLVIAEAKAMYKGMGTMNGEGEYNFLLTAIDADVNEHDNFDKDRFRIIIWGDRGIVYDNQRGADPTAEPTTELGGGSIVIHKGK